MGRQNPDRVIPGAVLSGGRSRRMGTDKAFVQVQGVPLAEHMARILEAGGCSPVVLIGRQATLRSLQRPLLQDEDPISHPIAGIIQGIENFAPSPVLFVPVDLPLLCASHIQLLRSSGGPCVAQNSGRLHPLLCVLDVDFLPRAHRLLERRGSVHELVADLERIELPRSALLNCNHPEDIHEIHGALRVT